MIPTWPAFAGAVVLASTISGAGAWTAQGWRLESRIAKAETTQANINTKAATDSLADLVRATGVINAAATRYGVVSTALAGRLDMLTKELHDAKPLPADCRPDAVRVRNLRSSIDAANAAVIGSSSSSTMP